MCLFNITSTSNTILKNSYLCNEYIIRLKANTMGKCFVFCYLWMWWGLDDQYYSIVTNQHTDLKICNSFKFLLNLKLWLIFYYYYYYAELLPKMFIWWFEFNAKDFLNTMFKSLITIKLIILRVSITISLIDKCNMRVYLKNNF